MLGVEMTDTRICVGGPYAGKRFAVDGHRDRFRLQVPQIPSATFGEYPQEPVASEMVTYRKDTFHTADGNLTVWVPEGQKPIETMRLLLEAYQRSPVADASR